MRIGRNCVTMYGVMRGVLISLVRIFMMRYFHFSLKNVAGCLKYKNFIYLLAMSFKGFYENFVTYQIIPDRQGTNLTQRMTEYEQNAEQKGTT